MESSVIHGPNIPGPYAILVFTALDFHHQTHGQSPLWPRLFILSGAVSNCPPLFPKSILDTFQPGGSSSGVFWPFHAVHGVSAARILKRLAIPSSSDLGKEMAIHSSILARDRGACCAAIHGVTQSQTRPTRRSRGNRSLQWTTFYQNSPP